MNEPRCFVVVPLSRPSKLAQILDMFDAQTFPAERRQLTLVPSGNAARLAVEERHVAGRALLAPPAFPHPSAARNAGLDHVARNADASDVLAFWDDDDLYGADYLDEVMVAAAPDALVGKQPQIVIDDAGAWLIERKTASVDRPRADRWLSSATMAAQIATWRKLQDFVGGRRIPSQPYFAPFEHVLYGEDTRLCLRARATAVRVLRLGPEHYAYVRDGSDHTFPGSIVDDARKIDQARRLGGFVREEPSPEHQWWKSGRGWLRRDVLADPKAWLLDDDTAT